MNAIIHFKEVVLILMEKIFRVHSGHLKYVTGCKMTPHASKDHACQESGKTWFVKILEAHLCTKIS